MVQFHWVAVVAGKNHSSHELQVCGKRSLFVLPKCKFIKRFCSDSRPSKFKTHPGSGDDLSDQLNYLLRISETIFELPVWSGLEHEST